MKKMFLPFVLLLALFSCSMMEQDLAGKFIESLVNPLGYPVVTPLDGSIALSDYITIEPPTNAADAFIFYSINEELEPTDKSLVYAGPFQLPADYVGKKVKIQTIAMKPGYENSKVWVKEYQISDGTPDEDGDDKEEGVVSTKLNSITLSAGSINFNSSVTEYNVAVPNSVTSTEISYIFADSKATATISPSTTLTLVAGETSTATIVVSNGNTSTTYTINITRANAGEVVLSSDATLSDLTVSSATFGFNKNVYDYAMEVESDVSVVVIGYTASSSKAIVKVLPSSILSLTAGATSTAIVNVTAEDGTELTYTVSVTRKKAPVVEIPKSDNANLSTIVITDGSLSFSADTTTYDVNVDNSVSSVTLSFSTEDSNAIATISPSATLSLSEGSTTSATITVTAEDGTTKNYYVNVTRATGSSGGDVGSGSEGVTTEYYWTNKDGKVGKNKTISGLGDWSTDMIISQSAACDTARSWLGGHEYPDPDLYALFAAWDNDNLYLMVEIPNVDDADTLSNDKCYAGSQFLPMGWAINTGKRTAGTGVLTDGGSVWQKKAVYEFQNGGVDTLIMHHPRLGIGVPGFFLTDSSGAFSYDPEYCLGFDDAGITREVYFNESVSSSMWAAVTDGEGNWGGKSSTDMTSYTYQDYKAAGKKMSAYQITISLDALGIDKNYIESTGIGVMVFSTYGESTMDCIPWDPSMIDNAANSYSKDPSSSQEKEDTDVITTKLARVGK